VKSKAEQFREHATDCVKLAASAQTEQARAMLMHMADAWVRLAASQEDMGHGSWKVTEPGGSEER
jgi:hypothetical protein